MFAVNQNRKKAEFFAARRRGSDNPRSHLHKKRFPILLFATLTFLLIAAHGALNASTPSNGGSADVLGWLLRSGDSPRPQQAFARRISNENLRASSRTGRSFVEGSSYTGRSFAEGSTRLASIRSLQRWSGGPSLEPKSKVVIERVGKKDSLSDLMGRQGVPLRTVHEVTLAADPVFNLTDRLQSGKLVKLSFDSNKKLTSLAYPVDDGQTLLIQKRESGQFFASISELSGSMPVSPSSPSEVTRLSALDQKSSDGKWLGQKSELAVRNILPKTVVEKVGRGDALAGVLARRNISPSTAMEVARASRPVYDLARFLRPGGVLSLSLADDGHLVGLSYSMDEESTFKLTLDGDLQFVPQIERKNQSRKPRFETIHAKIGSDGSLFTAAKKAGISDAQVAKLTGLFEWDIDFARDIRAGDRFSVIQEVKYSGGKRSRDGEIVGAKFTSQGQTFQAARYVDPDGNVGYYDAKGRNVRKMFIRAPVDFSYVSSPFSSSRKHPIFGFNRAHRGVDYAASSGTPIRSSGSGRVSFVGNKGDYGKFILVRHSTRYSTAYGHLSRYARGLQQGEKVKQGQVIGYVGSTGSSTGPHLHYEIRDYEQPVNPLSIQMASASSIPRKDLNKFRATTSRVFAMLKSDTTRVASLSPSFSW